METITVNRHVVLALITKNREAHRALFLEAIDGYRKRVIEELERRLDDIKKGRPINVHIALAVPMDQTKDYDRAIKMLEMSVIDNIELSETDFAQYVMDDWRWKDQVFAVNSSYTGRV